MVSSPSANDEIQVLLEDQQRINKFSRLNLRMKELDVEIEQLKVRDHFLWVWSIFTRRDYKHARTRWKKPRFA